MNLRRKHALVVTLALALSIASVELCALDKVSFGTDWKAQAEHGGFYQALATGLYTRHGLDVTLRPGGPQVNQAQLLAAGRLDFAMAPNSFLPLNFVKENVPLVAVAAAFQKDPWVLIAHPGQGHDSLAALKGKPIYVGADTRVGQWLFLKARFGYTDEQLRTYTFSVVPFLTNPKAIQQGYLTSEPFTIRKQGVQPVVHLLADEGYASYAALIVTQTRTVAERADLVQRFVDASLAGWESYMNGDPAPANALIKRDNPEMTDELLTYGREQLKSRGIVNSGDSLAQGLGVMTDTRWRAFFEMMASQGLYPKGMDFTKAYTLRFLRKPAASAPRPRS